MTQPLQEIIYKGHRIQFKEKHTPATPEHLTMIANNYFSTREVVDGVI